MFLKIDEFVSRAGSRRARRMYASVLNRLDEFMYRNGFDKVTTEVVARFLSGFSGVAARAYLWVILAYCREFPGDCDVDRRYLVNRFGSGVGQHDVMTREEVEKILSVCPQPHKAVLTIAYTYARRVGEVTTCRIVGDKVFFTLEKTFETVSFPLTDRVKAVVEDCVREGKCVSGERPFVITNEAVRYMFNKCLKQSGISTEGRRLTIHSLRASRITHLVQAGYPLELVIKTLRTHKSIQVAYEYYVGKLNVEDLLKV
jgi:integrase